MSYGPRQSPRPDEAGKQQPEPSEKIRRLQARANRVLLIVAVFIAVSIGAIRNFDLLPSLPSGVRAILGSPPSPNMISALLILYSFSAIILILARMMSGSGSYGGLSHIGYLTAFYLFYHFAGALAENFWAVFAAGMTILGLESYHVWTWCMDEIGKERASMEDAGRSRRSGRQRDD
ncbi:MAG TPA: menaquinol oxidoreductase [Geobacteraceae bacterium]